MIIHCEPQIGWQGPFTEKLQTGLRALGIASSVTSERGRQSDGLAILLGTTCWRSVEATGQYLLVDRCSFGDTNQFVSLVLNGHGRRGDHKAPSKPKSDRWKRMCTELEPWRKELRGRLVLCGQTEPYSPHFKTMADWYRSRTDCTHFRAHPAQSVNPTLLPEWDSFDGVAKFFTLNSSVGVAAILHGVETVVDDEGGMAWPGFSYGDDRMPWLRWLSYTQHHHSEVEDGTALRQMLG